MLTRKQQEILLELFFYKRLRGVDMIKNGIFSNGGDQARAMKELRIFNYVKVEKLSGKLNERVYTLTTWGRKFSIWLANQPNNEPRFKKLARKEWGSQFWVNTEGRVIWFKLT